MAVSKKKVSKKDGDARFVLVDRELKELHLEYEIWLALHLISTKEEVSLSVLLAHLNKRKQSGVSLENACRIFVLYYCMQVSLPGLSKEKVRIICLTSSGQTHTSAH